MVAQAQQVRVEGSDNIVSVAGRDVKLEFYTEETSRFYTPGLEPFRPPAFKPPQNIDELIRKLQGQHLLVVAGDPELDKSALARHVAWYLSESLAQQAGSDGVPILEWHRLSGDPQSLAVRIRQTEEATIFILPQIAPSDVGYDLLGLRNAAGAKHFVVASTDVAFPAWKQEPEDLSRPFWQDLSPEDVYTTGDLADILIQRLIEAEDTLPLNLLPDDVKQTASLGGGLSVREAAMRLRTSSNIAIFVQLLCAEADEIAPERVGELIDLARENRRTVQQWYHAVLTPREQLLALGLSLFDGMYDDQFFAALETVVASVWRLRDSSLRALDYCDLDSLRNFFTLIEIDKQTTKVESRLPDLRRTLFEVAWNSHRRQILTALPVVTQMVRDSVYKIGRDYELYGSAMRRQQLRDVASEALSDIGLISPHAIQGSLLRLAADGSWQVQAVAAEALARWHNDEYDNHEHLFETLDSWRRDTSLFVEDVEVEQKDKDPEAETEEENKEEKSSGIWANIRATMALTIGYAARYDPPNQLASALLDQLNQLSKDHSQEVRLRLAYFTLPMVVPLHLNQIHDILRGMTRYEDLIEGIGLSLARAYRRYPEDVLRIIGAWREEAHQISAQSADAGITQREGLLAAVALTYGHIELTEEIGPLTADETFNRLRDMLEEERSQFVRSKVVRAIALQASDYFEKVEPLLYEFVHVVTAEERSAIVRILTNIYLKQRRQLEHGEDTIEVGNESYPVWVETERSQLTKVEGAMFRWVKNPSNPLAQQIAMQAFVSFASSFDREEEHKVASLKIKQQRAAERAKQEEERALQPLARGLRRGGVFIDRLVPWLVTINAPEQREIIQGLLPEVVTQARDNRPLVNFVLERWPRLSKDLSLGTIVKKLKRGVSLSKNLGWAIAAALFILVNFLCLCICLISALLDSL